jgi:hypothetical protein
MIVSIHQPNLWPWLGFFDKMAASNLFILLDTVPFTKGGFQNRVQLKGTNGALWLTVPVITAKRLGQSTLDVELNSSSHWQRDHMRSFQAYYAKTAAYETMMPVLEELYRHQYQKLTSFTEPGIVWIAQMLGIGTRLVKASELNVSGSGSQLLCDLVREAGGSTYLSGPSGRRYLDEEVFRKQGIEVHYHSFTPFPYTQRFGDFIGGLSALDYLFNEPDLVAWQNRP